MSHWTIYRPNNRTPWDIKRVVKLHRRAAFAATWDDIQRDQRSGPVEAIDRLLDGHRRTDSNDSFEVLSTSIGDAATASNSAARLKAWWFYRMLHSPDPLGERLTLMWHNHFATSNRKVDHLAWMLDQNRILRKNARGSFGHLLTRTLKHPAMLKWLDADANRKGQANENLARELLELFTLGVGNYTESDVQAAARALTGWTIKDNEFVYHRSRHDDRDLVLFGKRSRLDGDELLQRTQDHPATARRLAWRICTTLMGEGTCDEPAINDLAEGFIRNELNIRWAVETVLRSERFFADSNIRSRISGPAEHIVATITALELHKPPPSTLQLGEWSARMGLDLFYPPNVGGWTEGRSWLGSRAVIARRNFAHALTSGRLWRSRNVNDMESELESLFLRHGVEPHLRRRANWLVTLLRGRRSIPMSTQVTRKIEASNTPMADLAGHVLASSEHQLS